MSDIILVKHAEPEILAEAAASQWGLSRTGRLQSEELAARLIPYEPVSIFSSDALKARQTAQILSSQFGNAFTSQAELDENDRTGLPFYTDIAAYNARMEAFFRSPSELSVGRETADQAHTRFLSAVKRLMSSVSKGPVVVVSHGAVISLLVARANDLDPYSFWSRFGFTSMAALTGPSFALNEVVHGWIP